MTTSNFGFNTPAFGSSNWHTPINNNFIAIDTLLSLFSSSTGVTLQGQWLNDTAYALNDIAIDFDGALFRCLVAHTSDSSPVTFTADRTANPTYWGALSTYLSGGENLSHRFSVAAQASTTFDMSSCWDASFTSRFIGTYVSTAGSPAELELRLTLAGTPISATYDWTRYRIGTGGGGSYGSTSDYFDMSNATTADEEVAFIIELRYGYAQFYGIYQTFHYDGSAICSQEGMFRVVAASSVADGISLQNTGTTITANAAVSRRPFA